MARTRREGQVERCGKRWRIRWFIGEDSDGKRKYTSVTLPAGTTRTEAALRKCLHDRDRGQHYIAANLTVGELLDDWLEHIKGIRRPSTHLVPCLDA